MEDIDNEIEEAEKRLKDLKAKKELAIKNDLSFIKPFKSITVEEKVAFFDECYNFGKAVIEDKLDGRWHEDNDNDTYAYEAIMPVLAKDPKTFWNSLSTFLNSDDEE